MSTAGSSQNAPPGRELAVLLAAGHRDGQGVRDLPGLLQLPVGARLLEMLDAMVLEQPADLDGPLGREAAVGVGEQCRIRAQRFADRRHDRLGAAGPLVDIVAAFRRRPGT